eukprot:12401005-Karenia_brevis.AAC.1
MGYELVFGDQCHWNLRRFGSQERLKKGTGFMVPYWSQLKYAMNERCSGDHVHGTVMGGAS